MALQRIKLSTPCSLRGVDQDFPKELQPMIQELVRRIENNREALIRDLYQQVLVDPSIMPNLLNGETATTEATVATSGDIQDSQIDGAFSI